MTAGCVLFFGDDVVAGRGDQGLSPPPGSGAYDELARVVREDWLDWLGRRST
jgi:hypothetical protein